MLKNFKDLIFYEIYPNSFKDSNGDGFGDLKGIISELDYVKSMGFSGIWLNPIYDSPFLDGGYDIRDPFKVSPRFGTNDDLKELISEMHKRDMRLFLDLVPGHMSITNERFLNSAKGTKNEDSDLFVWNNCVWDLEPNLRLISGMFERNGCFLVNFFAHQPAINYGFNRKDYSWQKGIDSEGATKGRKFLESIMKFYLDLGVDGFRVDMADSLVKNDDDKFETIKTWHIILDDLRKEGYKDFYMTSEWSNPRQSLEAGFSSDFVLDHEHNCNHMLFRQWEHDKLPLVKKYDEELYVKCMKDLDERVKASKEFKGELSFISGNHDSKRLANFLDRDELKVAYLLLMTLPGVPYIYYGDEIEAHTVEDMVSFEGGYHRTGSRLMMKYDSSKNYGFSSSDTTYLPPNDSDLTLEESKKDKDSVYNFLKKAISMRNENEELRDTSNFELLDYKFGFVRGDIVVLANLLDEEQIYKAKVSKTLLSTGEVLVKESEVILKPHSAIAFKVVR